MNICAGMTDVTDEGGMMADLNIERVKAVMEAIQANPEFDMGQVLSDDVADYTTMADLRSSQYQCNSPCCVAGTALVMFAPEPWYVGGNFDGTLISDTEGCGMSWFEEARKLLGLNDDQAELFSNHKATKAYVLAEMQRWIIAASEAK